MESLERRELLAGDINSLLGIGTDVGRVQGHDVATDASGNTYIAGTFDSYYTSDVTAPIDLDPARTYVDNRDILALPPGNPAAGADAGATAFFAKYLPDGSLDWVRRADRDNSQMSPMRIAIAPLTGGIYFAGMIFGSNFTIDGVSATAPPGRYAGKLNADGSVGWIKSFGSGTLANSTTGIAVDETNNRLFVSGQQMLSNPGVNSGVVFALNIANVTNVQVAWRADLVASATRGAWADMRDVAVDSAGNVVAVGNFAGGADFDPGAGKTNLSTGGGNYPPVAHFIWKLNGNGSFGWVKQFQAAKNSGWDAWTVGIDPADTANNIYVGGSFGGTVDFQPGTGTVNMTSSSGGNAYLVKMTAAGTVTYARQYGGAGDQVARSIAFDAAGVYLLGGSATPNGRLASLFVARFDKSSGSATWQTVISGQLNSYGYGQIEAYGLAVNSVTGQVHVLGWFMGPIEADGDPSPELDSGDTTEDLLWLTLNVV